MYVKDDPPLRFAEFYQQVQWYAEHQQISGDELAELTAWTAGYLQRLRDLARGHDRRGVAVMTLLAAYEDAVISGSNYDG